MKVSARNVFKGKISALTDGAVNAEVELALAGGEKIVAIVTQSSVKSLGLAVGKEAIAYVKASWVILLSGPADVRFSARNQLEGTIKSVARGAINSEVLLELPGGAIVYSVVTNESVDQMGLAAGGKAIALIKASHVILGVPA